MGYVYAYDNDDDCICGIWLALREGIAWNGSWCMERSIALAVALHGTGRVALDIGVRIGHMADSLIHSYSRGMAASLIHIYSSETTRLVS